MASVSFGNIVFSGGGVVVGGSSGNSAGMNETRVGNVRVQYGPEQGGSRRVVINGQMHIGLSRGSSSSMSVNGVNVRAQDGELWINSTKVDFGKPMDPAQAAAETARALAGIRGRYPGVNFVGTGSSDQIDSTVRIAPGATLDLSGGTELRGSTSLSRTANVSGGVITDAQIEGNVTGGVINGGHIAIDASVSGGVLNKASVAANARVSGGVLNGAQVQDGARVSGGILNGYVVRPGERISGGIW